MAPFRGMENSGLEAGLRDAVEASLASVGAPGPGCSVGCPLPPPASGQFGSPNRSGHRWFTPAYRSYPSNLWHLAQAVRHRLIGAAGGERGVPSEANVRQAIAEHPCNRHLAGKMFLPRFGPDRCTGRGNYFGAIYIPFNLDKPVNPADARRKRPKVRLARETFALDSSLDWTNVRAGHLANLLAQCQYTIPVELPGEDERVPVGDTRRAPYRWICTLFMIYPSMPGFSGPVAARASGFLLDVRHLITSAHVLYMYSDIDPAVLLVPSTIVYIPGYDPTLWPSKEPLPFGAFAVSRRGPTGAANFHVPGEWIMSVPPTGVAGDPQFDYGVIDVGERRGLAPGEPIDSWTSVSPVVANVAASNLGEPEDLARDVLKRRGKGFRTAGYPGDKECLPIQTDAFEFVALELALGSQHNVLLHRADMFFGMSGSPVWLKGAGKNAPGGRKPHSLIGIVEGGRGPLLSDKGFHMTYSTLITPKVLNRLTNTAFLSSL